MSAIRTLMGINIVVGVTLLIGFASNVVIAGTFGLTRMLDAYFSAIVLPSLFMTMFVDFLGKNFLPVLTEEADGCLANASEFISTIISLVILGSLALTVCTVVFAPQVFAVVLPGFSPEELVSVTTMYWVMSPVITLMAVNAFNEYVWQYRENYKRVVISKLFLPVSILGSVLVFSRVLEEYALPVGFVAGHLLGFVFLAKGAGYRYKFRLGPRGGNVRRVFVNSGILMGTGLLGRLKPLLEKVFGSTLDAGAITGIAMASKLVDPLRTSALIGVKMMSFTKSAQLYTQNRMEQLGELYNKTTGAVFMVLAPLVVWIGMNAEGIVRALFERGQFDRDMSQLVSLALVGLIPSVLVRGANQIVSNGFYAMNKILVPAILAPVTTVLFVVLASFLVGDYGVLGLAAATSITFSIGFLINIFMLSRYIDSFNAGRVLVRLLWYITFAIMTFMVTEYMTHTFLQGGVIFLLVTLCFGSVAYLAGLFLIRDEGVMLLFNKTTVRVQG